MHEIPNRDFSHGGTRNLMMNLAESPHVAFLTQDATPAHDGWLAALLSGFEAADDVAAVFGPHQARPGASHMIAAEMDRHFASWGDGERVEVQRLDRSPRGIAEYRAFPGALTFLSDVNCAVARWAWERVPYREVPYAEDQLLGRELIEAGFAKVFHPGARVLHSHDYPPLSFLRRYFDEFRSLREVLDFKQPWGPRQTVRDIRGLVGADRRWLRSRGVNGPRLVRALLVSGRHHALRMAGSIVGTRADRLPAGLRKALSLEGRSTFTLFETPTSTLLEGGQAFDPEWEWEFVRKRYPRHPLVLEPHSGRPSGPLTIAWVVPPWEIGSGGHTTIFRLVREMELRGHRCALYLFDPEGSKRRAGQDLRREIREHFIPIDAPVAYGLEGFQPADLAVATEWRTAFPISELPGCREKVYLVQDHEPQFYPTSTESIWAEDSYRLGYRCVAYTPWMADLLRERYGVDARYFECGTDTDTYRFASERDREPGLVAVYARRETNRRAVELAVAGLATLFERRPGLRVALFGAHFGVKAPFPGEDLGVLPPRELAALYQRASAGVVFSLTTHSLVAQEMMAAGLPLVELEGANVSSALGPSGELVELAERTPDAIADSLERLLDDRTHAAAMAARARQFVEPRTWKRAGDQLEEALQDFMARPSSERSASSRP